MSRADVTAWESYVRTECTKFYAHCEGETYIWQETPGAKRVFARIGKSDHEHAAFSGPWHVVRAHVTTEFRQWVEEYEGTERLTFNQWRARGIAERGEVAFTETAEHTLGQLAELRRLIAERDALIVEASKRGASKVAIAASVGLSRQQVHAVINAAELAPVTPIRPGIDEVATEWVTTASGETVEVF